MPPLSLEYYGTLISLIRLLVQSGTPLDLTWQNIITHAEVRLETLVRLYYLRHSFESYDPLLMHWLMFLGDTILLKLDGGLNSAGALAALALAWLLHRSPVMLPIPGTSRVSHLEQNVEAARIELSDEEFRRIADAVR